MDQYAVFKGVPCPPSAASQPWTRVYVDLSGLDAQVSDTNLAGIASAALGDMRKLEEILTTSDRGYPRGFVVIAGQDGATTIYRLTAQDWRSPELDTYQWTLVNGRVVQEGHIEQRSEPLFDAENAHRQKTNAPVGWATITDALRVVWRARGLAVREVPTTLTYAMQGNGHALRRNGK